MNAPVIAVGVVAVIFILGHVWQTKNDMCPKGGRHCIHFETKTSSKCVNIFHPNTVSYYECCKCGRKR